MTPDKQEAEVTREMVKAGERKLSLALQANCDDAEAVQAIYLAMRALDPAFAALNPPSPVTPDPSPHGGTNE